MSDTSGQININKILKYLESKKVNPATLNNFLSSVNLENKNEEESNDYKNLFKDVINASPNLIFVKDKKGAFVLGNDAVAKIYGTNIKNLIGKTDADFNPNQSELDWYSKDDQYVICEKKELFIPEEKVTGADGKIEWFETTKKPITLSNGETCVLGISTNITKRKELFEQLSQSQKLEALGQLAGGVAHDINNILTVILGFTSVIDYKSTTKYNLKNAVNGIEKAVNGASGLTQKLLGFARKGKNININLNINDVISETVELLKRTIEGNILISMNLCKSNLFVLGDPIQIQQVILNLAINARDAMTKSKGGTLGGTLNISSEEITIDNKYSTTKNLDEGDYIKFIIKDTGCGMNEETMQKIFEPFFTTKPSEYGTGLGLAMVYGIIDNHGGKISIRSKIDCGTEIEVYLPRVKNVEQSDNFHIESKKVAIKKGVGNILLIDDNKEIIDVLSMMIQNLGYAVTTSVDRSKAIDLFKKHNNKYDLVVMDMMMPGIDAVEAVKQLREIDESIKIVISTGYAKNNSVQEILSRHNTSFIQKPYRINKLSILIDDLINS